MPTITEFLQRSSAGAVLVQAAIWARLVNNLTGTTYRSVIQSDGNGQVTVNNIPPGDYSLYYEASNVSTNGTLIDPHYQVAPSLLRLANPMDYGAVFDGATDDSAAWQLAINDVRDGKYGGLWHPGGTSMAKGLIWYDNVYLHGLGTNVCMLKLANGAGTFLIQTRDFAILTGTNPVSPNNQGPSHWGWNNITFDGNKANNVGAPALIQTYGYDMTCYNFNIRNSGGDGWYSEWSTAAGSPAGSDAMEGKLLNYKVHDNVGNGLMWNGPHDAELVNGLSFQNGLRGHWMQSKGGSWLTQVHSWGSSQTDAFQLDSSNHLVNCCGEGASRSQVTFNSNDCSIVGGTYFGGGAASSIFQIGDTQSVAGISIDCKVLNAQVSVLNIVNEAAGVVNRYRIQAYGANPIFSGNAPLNIDLIDITVSGGAAQVTGQIPHDVIIGFAAAGKNVILVAGAAAGNNPVSLQAQGSATIPFQIVSAGLGVISLLPSQANANGVDFNPTATGGNPFFRPNGTDVNVSLGIYGKGTGGVQLGANFANYYFVQGANGGVTPTIQAIGTDTNIAFKIVAKGNSGIFLGSSDGTRNTWQFNTAAAGNPIGLFAIGNDTNIGVQINAKGTGAVVFLNNGGTGNNISLQPVAAGNPVQFAVASGSADPNVAIQIIAKGTGIITLNNGNANALQVNPGATGNPTALSAIGTDVDIDLRLTPKGAGQIDINKATVALGGGAVPTLGTIGGTGPAAAAQNCWVPIKVAGTLTFIPGWR